MYCDALIPASKVINSYRIERFNEPHVERIEYYNSIPVEIKIKACYLDDEGREVTFQSDSSPIPKNRKIKYYATSSTVHPPYVVYWQVVNTGAEAAFRRTLRGGLFSQKAGWNGGLVLEEASKYSGMHWVECFFMNRGMYVARSGRFVVNID